VIAPLPRDVLLRARIRGLLIRAGIEPAWIDMTSQGVELLFALVAIVEAAEQRSACAEDQKEG
jgi:hypothetical protein